VRGPPKVSPVVHVPQVARISSQKKTNTFIVPVQIQINECGLKSQGLCDTGADIRLSMSPKLASKAIEHLGARLKPLNKPLQLTGYRKKATEEATHKIVATFELDGRKFKDQEFLIVDTCHDVFIGQEWLTE
jgi:hypothetical protein